MAKKINTRCPLQAECERTCKYEKEEITCDYYAANAVGDRVIEDQEQIRRERERLRQEELDKEMYAGNTDRSYIPGEIVRLPIEKLHPHPDNPRKELGDLTEMADSIRTKGILQNLTVVMQQEPDGRALEEHDYTIIIGHRRRAASELAGLTHLPCVITYMTPQEQVETMAIENLQRKELTPYEQAECFQMMLDMGSSVEKITKDTGFSESTVRRRVKLLELDKEKFNKAEQRGGMMQDYLKLNEIRDPEVRNKVLDKIGTKDFNYYLEDALKNQEYLEKFAQVLELLEQADWCKKRTDEKYGWGTAYQEQYVYFSRYGQRKITPPKDTDVATYIYVADDRSVTVYRKGPKKKEKKDPAQTRKERLEKDLEKIRGKMIELSNIQRELRLSYIKNFSAFNANQAQIVALAAREMVADKCRYTDITLMGKLLDISVKRKDYRDIPDAKSWQKLLDDQPLWALLGACFARLEYGSNYYYTSKWDSVPGLSIPEHYHNTTLDLSYECLQALGYEMSEEETQMQNGTHPLFQEVKELIKAYNKEKKDAEAEKKKGAKKGSKKK